MYVKRNKVEPTQTKSSYELGVDARNANSLECPFDLSSADGKQWTKGWSDQDFNIWFESHQKPKE